jgi:hypothetical protein
MSRQFGLLEMGTHSLKYHWFGEQAKDRRKILSDKYPWTVSSRVFTEGELTQAEIDVVVGHIARAKEDHPTQNLEAELAIATGAFRHVKDLRRLWHTIHDRTGVHPHLLEGKAEAKLMVGAFRRMGLPRPSLLCDVGGGSTQWVLLEDDRPPSFGSVGIGADYLALRYPLGDEDPQELLQRCREHCAELLESLPERDLSTLAFTGGTARSLYRYERSRASADLGELAIIKSSRLRTRVERIARFGTPPKTRLDREPVIVQGFLIMEALVARYGMESFQYSGRKVRKGMVRHLLYLLEAHQEHVSDPGELLVRSLIRSGTEQRGLIEELIDEEEAPLEFEGRTLSSWLIEARPQPDKIQKTLLDVGRLLSQRHACGEVHGWLAPHHLCIGDKDQVRLLDGPPATMAEAAERPARQPLGSKASRAYAAPECLQGREADHRSDQFSFAAIVYEAMAGAHPWADGDWGEMALGSRLPRPRDLSRIPKALRRPLQRALSLRPGDRYPSLAAFLDEMDRDLLQPELRRMSVVGFLLLFGPLVVFFALKACSS